MGWVSGPELTAATANAGGLGILAAAVMDMDELRAAVKELRERTDRPFGVNLRADQPDIVERADLLVKEGVKVASFAMAPRADLVKRLKDGGAVVIRSIGARRHAEKVAEWGVDAVIAQGSEGGGHTGQVPTSLLLPQVVDAVDIPVVAAGGFFDGRGLVAALAYGAAGIAMGTRFLLTRESTVPGGIKQVYLDTAVTGTVVTKSVDGVPQRVIVTPFIDKLERAGRLRRLVGALRHAWAFRALTGASFWSLLREGWAMRKAQGLTLEQMSLAAAAPMLTKAALVDGKPEVGILPTGQNVGLIDELPSVADLIARIIDEAEATLTLLSKPAAAPRRAS